MKIAIGDNFYCCLSKKVFDHLIAKGWEVTLYKKETDEWFNPRARLGVFKGEVSILSGDYVFTEVLTRSEVRAHPDVIEALHLYPCEGVEIIDIPVSSPSAVLILELEGEKEFIVRKDNFWGLEGTFHPSNWERYH